MTATIRTTILRANALYLLVAASGGLLADIIGVVFATGPQGPIIGSAPHAGIGFVEAHGLALIISVLLWQAPPQRAWHVAATAVHVLLGTSNLAFWQIFVAGNMLPAGYVTTSLHGLFAVLQLVAALAAGTRVDAEAATRVAILAVSAQRR
jgi:hypothetical protein